MTILTSIQLQSIIDLDPPDGSGDRVAAYLKLWQLTGSPEALIQANIASFSGGIGGAAFGANLAIQEHLGVSYPGIFPLSESVFQNSIETVAQDLALINEGSISIDQALYNGAAHAWESAGLEADFPGNLFAYISDGANITAAPALSLVPGVGFALDGSAAGVFYGKSQNDFSGLSGYVTQSVTDVTGQIVPEIIDPTGRVVYVGLAGNSIASLENILLDLPLTVGFDPAMTQLEVTGLQNQRIHEEQDSMSVSSTGMITVFNPQNNSVFDDFGDIQTVGGNISFSTYLIYNTASDAATALVWNGYDTVALGTSASSQIETLDSGSVLASIGPNGSQNIDIILTGGMSFSATNQSQLVLATGVSDTLQAGANDVTLAALGDIGGTSLFENGNYTGVTEMVLNAGESVASLGTTETDPSINLFSFGSGANVLIGDGGNNTFVENLTATSATNIIWGGGGTSTYELSGYIDILYTQGTPTAQEVENLNVNKLLETMDLDTSNLGTTNVTFLIDPTKNDVLELLSYPTIFNEYSNTPFTVSGTPTYSSVAGDYVGQELLQNGNTLGFGNNTDSNFGKQIVADPFEISQQVLTADHVQEVGSINEIFNPYVPGEFGISLLNPSSYEAFQETIDTGSSPATGSGNVLSGSSEAVFSGVVTSGLSITAGGAETLLGDSVSDGSVITNEGIEVVSSSGVASGSTISTTGTEIVYSGGVDYAAQIGAGGVEDVLFAGTVSGATVSSGGLEVVASGGLTSLVVVQSGGIEIVSANGLTSGNTVQTGGAEIVLSGGTAYGGVVASGGLVLLAPGGTETGATVTSGGSIISDGTVIYEPGTIKAAPTSLNALVLTTGDDEYVMPGGRSFNMDINGAVQFVLSGGYIQNTSLTSNGEEFVYSGGSAVGTKLNAPGTMYVYSGGVAYNANVESGGIAVVEGGESEAAGILRGGQELIYSGGIASGAALTNGGREIVFGGGTASAIAVDSAGGEIVSSGGTTQGDAVYSGGFEVVFGGGIANSTTVEAGGYLIALPGSEINAPTLVSGSFIISTGIVVTKPQTISAYPSSSTVSAIGSGGAQYVMSGGNALNTTFSAGGTEWVVSGGVTSNVNLRSGGSQIVLFGGAASNTSIGSGADDIVSGGVAYAAVISNGGTEIINDGGKTSSAFVLSGGTEAVSSGGTAYITTISSGGVEVVYAGGSTSAVTVASGGTQSILSGGVAYATTVNKGGKQVVSGIVSASKVNSGGVVTVFSGGIVSTTTLNSGGELIVSAGGSENGAYVNSGGTLSVLSGGIAGSDIIGSLGLEVLATGATTVGNITFSGAGGTLSLGQTSLTSSVINGFDASSTTDEIVLAGVSYSSATDTATLYGGNVLVLDLSGTVSAILFDPNQNFAGETFILTSSSQGYVTIEDPRISQRPERALSPWLGGHSMSFLSPAADDASVEAQDAFDTPSIFATSSSSRDYLPIAAPGRPIELIPYLGLPSGNITSQSLPKAGQISMIAHSGFG